MTLATIIGLLAIGVLAGVLSGFVGIGGGILVVPALVYVFGLTQFMAQGTSLFLMLPPIGILAFVNYYKAGNVNVSYGILIALAFIIGGYLGSKLALRMNENIVKIIFGAIMAYVAFKMMYSGINTLRNES